MTPQTSEAITLDETAASWILRLEENNSTDQAAFIEWLQRDPRHVKAYMAAYQTYRLLDELDQEREIDVETLTGSRLANVIPLRFLRRRKSAPMETAQSGRVRLAVWGLVGALLFAMAGGGIWIGNDLWSRQEFETRVGEQREIKLDDGSIVQLNTRSRIAVDYSKSQRQVRLLDGEALFTVVRDAVRPFRVSAGNTTIQALGTQFNVYRRGNETTVTVTEGAVALEPPADPKMRQNSLAHLKAGEQASVNEKGKVLKSSVPEIEHSVAWRKRELVFRDTELTDVIVEFNRYNRIPLRLIGDAGRDMRISGIFSADYPQSLMLYLGRNPAIEVEHTDEAVLIRKNPSVNVPDR